jgi:flagellar M-ring protein FliF
VLVNRTALLATLGDKPSPEAIDKQVKEIEALVASAAGLDKKRGDSMEVAVVDFIDSSHDLEPVAGPSLIEIVARQSGAFLNAGAVVVVAALLIWFGFRPAIKALTAPPALLAQAAFEAPHPALALPKSEGAGEPGFLIEAKDERDEFLEALLERKDKSPQRHLQKLVDFDEAHAAAILKQWIRQGANA